MKMRHSSTPLRGILRQSLLLRHNLLPRCCLLLLLRPCARSRRDIPERVPRLRRCQKRLTTSRHTRMFINPPRLKDDLVPAQSLILPLHTPLPRRMVRPLIISMDSNESVNAGLDVRSVAPKAARDGAESRGLQDRAVEMETLAQVLD